MNDYDPKKDLGATIRLLSVILEKGSGLAKHIDAQSNILIGVDLAIFVFASSRFTAAPDAFFAALSLFAALSSFLALLAVHPPGFMRKRGQEESLLYHKRVTDFASADEYRKAMDGIDGEHDAIVRQFALETYNLYKYSYLPKRRLYKIARNLLLAGIVIGVSVRIAQLLF